MVLDGEPKRCSKCKSTKWNAGSAEKPEGGIQARTLPPRPIAVVDAPPVVTLPDDEDWPKPVAELEDTGEPYKVSETKVSKLVGKAKKNTAEEGWQLCTHGMLKFMCKREHA
jgi:hypothetical protein